MRTYVIIDASEVANIDYRKILQNPADPLTYSLDGTKTVVKFEGDETPSFLVGKPQHNHAQILEILSGPEWSSSEEV